MSGQIFVISGPAGAGKSSLSKLLRASFPGLGYSVSHTTRPPRAGEVHGKDYYFISREEFTVKVERGDMLEHVEVFNNLYGTSKDALETILRQGRDILLEIEVQGAGGIKRAFPDSILIFVLPPSLGLLRQRLQGRGTESEEVINQRLDRLQYELGRMEEFYDYLVINDELTRAARELESIVVAAGARFTTVWPRIASQWSDK